MREYDLSITRWRKSSFSEGNGGDCLEVLDVVPVRASKNPTGLALIAPAAAWAAFVVGVRRG